MKGVVFTQFIEMMDQQFSPELSESVIMEAGLPSGGVYTATGTYDHSELISMVVKLGEKTGHAVSDLVESFGIFLFKALINSEAVELDIADSYFDFLHQVDDYIHVEVRKLYPDAQLPTIRCQSISKEEMRVEYQSRCPFADLASGLLKASASHFSTEAEIEQTDRSAENTSATFTIRL